MEYYVVAKINIDHNIDNDYYYYYIREIIGVFFDVNQAQQIRDDLNRFYSFDLCVILNSKLSEYI